MEACNSNIACRRVNALKVTATLRTAKARGFIENWSSQLVWSCEDTVCDDTAWEDTTCEITYFLDIACEDTAFQSTLCEDNGCEDSASEDTVHEGTVCEGTVYEDTDCADLVLGYCP